MDINSTLGKYQLICELGAGGMGKVYKAQDTILKRIVALKLLQQQQNSQLIQRFLIEAQACAKLDHPNIIRILEIGKEQNKHFFAMEFIEGASLAEHVKNKINLRKAVAIIKKVAVAIHYAHEQGIIHRDLKPANIMLTQEGEPKIADFGLAKMVNEDQHLTKTGEIMGTTYYMPPEQLEGRRSHIDAQSDVYSLGVVLYQVTTGKLPFSGSSAQIIKKIMIDEPVAPIQLNARLPKKLNDICLKAMAKDKAKRYKTAKAFAKDLEEVFSKKISKKEDKALKKHFPIAITATIVILFLIVFLAIKPTKKSKIKHTQKSSAKTAKETFTTKESAETYFHKAKIAHNKKEAILLFEKAARLGHSEAMWHLGHASFQGTEVPRDYKKAIFWLKKSSQKNNPQAMFLLGKAYANGKGVELSYQKAIFWFKKSGKKGNIDAITNTGICYHRLDKNIEAKKWFEKAANLGDPYAMYNLGGLYAKGWGIEKNMQKAIAFFRKAAQAGHSEAAQALKQLGKKNSREYIANQQRHIVKTSQCGRC